MHYKVPRYWRMIEQFPMIVSGKVQKYKLREVVLQEPEFSQPAPSRKE